MIEQFWNWYFQLFHDNDKKVIVAAWSATVTTMGFILTFLVKPIRQYLAEKTKSKFNQSFKTTNIGKGFEGNETNLWSTIRPTKSRFKNTSEVTDSVETVTQSFSFEYSPTGHAYALNLKGKTVRCEIHFSCELSNAYKAVFGSDQYSLNFLQPEFLIEARTILETYTLKNLREKRKIIATEIFEN